METLYSVDALRNAIELLSIEQAEKEQQLKEEFFLVYESIKPVNLLKRTIKDFGTSPWLIEDMLVTTLGLATGYTSKRFIVGTSTSFLRRLIGSVVQIGVTKTITQNQETLKSWVHHLFETILQNKQKK